MSNNGSVGGVGVSSSPYTKETPDETSRVGQTDGGRKVTTDSNTGQTYIPGKPDNDTPAPSPLSKRKVAHHVGDKKLKNMPDGGDGYKPLGGKEGSTASKTPPGKDPLTGQELPQPGLKPRVTVESATPLSSLPPLTQEQQEHKNKFISALTVAQGFVKQHKNSFAMGGGAALTVVGIAFMAFPPTAVIGIFPAVIGFTMLTTGFSFAMTNTDLGGPTPPTPPPQPPKNDNDEESKKKKNDPVGGSSSTPSSPATPKGHFAKIDHPSGSPAPKPAEPQETPEEIAIKKRKSEMLHFKQHMIARLQAVIKEDAKRREGIENGEGAPVSPDLNKQIIEIVSEFAARAGMRADEDFMAKIAESGRLIESVMKNTEGMTLEERQKAFQKAYVSMIQDFDVSEDAIELLCAGFDEILEQQNDSLSEAVKAILSSTSALLKAFMGDRDASGRKMVSLEDLYAAIERVDTSGGESSSLHVRALRIALEDQGVKTDMEKSALDQVKGRLYSDALDLLPQKMTGEEFRVAMIAKVDPNKRPEDYIFLNNALNNHKWFDANSS